MVFRKDQMQRTVHTPAKLNLYLEVLGRRSDGYHELETLMVPIGLRDSLTIAATPAPSDGSLGEISLAVLSASAVRPPPRQPDDVPEGSENLVVRALRLLRERSGTRTGAQVTLVKRIPVAAGLGGGSTDAAAALRLGNQLWRLGYSIPQLTAFAAELGSDVPFFVNPRAAVCRGRGEQIEPIVGGAELHAVVVKPPHGLSTPAVFRAYDSITATPYAGSRYSGRLAAVVSALRRGRWVDIGRTMINRLESAAATLLPWINEVRGVFDRLDCVGHQLSGSGSAYFGLCRHASHARKLATMLRARRLGLVFAASSCP